MRWGKHPFSEERRKREKRVEWGKRTSINWANNEWNPSKRSGHMKKESTGQRLWQGRGKRI